MFKFEVYVLLSVRTNQVYSRGYSYECRVLRVGSIHLKGRKKVEAYKAVVLKEIKLMEEQKVEGGCDSDMFLPAELCWDAQLANAGCSQLPVLDLLGLRPEC